MYLCNRLMKEGTSSVPESVRHYLLDKDFFSGILNFLVSFKDLPNKSSTYELNSNCWWFELDYFWVEPAALAVYNSYHFIKYWINSLFTKWEQSLIFSALFLFSQVHIVKTWTLILWYLNKYYSMIFIRCYYKSSSISH